jgi:hypothetical protein
MSIDDGPSFLSGRHSHSGHHQNIIVDMLISKNILSSNSMLIFYVHPLTLLETNAVACPTLAEYTICDAVMIGRPQQMVSPVAQIVRILSLGTPGIVLPSNGSPKSTYT